MITFLEEVKEKIKKKLNPEKLLLVDNSYLHAGHKSFDNNKFNLKLVIKSKKLNKMNKIEAHKLIYSILKDEISTKIHALEINIK